MTGGKCILHSSCCVHLGKQREEGVGYGQTGIGPPDMGLYPIYFNPMFVWQSRFNLCSFKWCTVFCNSNKKQNIFPLPAVMDCWWPMIMEVLTWFSLYYQCKSADSYFFHWKLLLIFFTVLLHKCSTRVAFLLLSVELSFQNVTNIEYIHNLLCCKDNTRSQELHRCSLKKKFNPESLVRK